MAKRRRKKRKRSVRVQRGVTPHRQSLLELDATQKFNRLARKLEDRRYRDKVRPYPPRKSMYKKRDNFWKKEREAMGRRFTPDIYARALEVRNILKSKEAWICAKRKSRREGLFGSGSIGKNKIVSKLRRMTIDSLVDCRRR